MRVSMAWQKPTGATSDDILEPKAAPTSPVEGEMYLDSGDATVRIYYDGGWHTLHTIVTGTNFTFMDDVDYAYMDADTFEYMNA